MSTSTTRIPNNNQRVIYELIAIFILGLATLIPSAFVVVKSLHLQTNSQQLPSPDPLLDISIADPATLATMLAVASVHGGEASVTREIRLQPADHLSYRHLMSNIALQRGWYPQLTTPSRLQLVVPSTDLPALDAMITNPVEWVVRHRDPGAPARLPSTNDNLQSVMIHIHSTHLWPSTFWFVTAFIACIASLCAIVIPLSVIGEFTRSPGRGKTS